MGIKWLFFLLFLVLILFACHNISFDAQKWQSWNEQNEAERNTRWDMSDDLINNHLKIGMSAKEVSEILEGSSWRIDSKTEVLTYNLGPCRSGIDYGTLYLHFAQGKLTKVERHCN